jgi:membrane protein YdbS with pleckstrin-like domain
MPGAPIPLEIARLERPREQLLTWYFLKALATVIAFPVTMLVFYFRYHTMRYKFDEDGIHMSWGILMRHEIMLNYSRIQDIQLHSNVIERWLGLTRIEVQTAAGASDSEMTLEGMPDPEAMRDFLYSRMRGAHTAAPAPANAAPEALQAVLLEIASELRSIREVLEARKA